MSSSSSLGLAPVRLRGGLGTSVLVEQSQKAKDEETAYDEAEMVGTEAIELRRKYPTLKKAWDQYRVIWRLVNDND